MSRLICESCDHGYAPNAPSCPWCHASAQLANLSHDTATVDTECYKDYWLCMFDTGEVFQLTAGTPLDIEGLRRALSRYTVITFNGIHYDFPIISLALQGHDNATLKCSSDAIIVGNKRPWEITRDLLEWVDHVDMFDVVPGQASLKMYGAKMHSRKLQDLPIKPDASIAWYDCVLLRDYCRNDLATTRELYDTFPTQLQLRAEMSAEYSVDLRSKSDAQIAEAVMKSLLPFKVERPYIAAGTQFMYRPPEWVQFQHLPLLGLLARNPFTVSVPGGVEMPDELANTVIRIGNSAYKMGIGGLHSMESCIAHRADTDCEITDHDVASYYPSLILRTGIYPQQIGAAFVTIYRGWYDRRLAAKRAGNKKIANSLKTLLNGTFGKLGSMWSIFYAPSEMIQVTVTGQLALLMLIEAFESCGIAVISANTDGIVVKTPRNLAWLRDDCIKWWESVTQFETERTDYTLLASRDVNSYVAVKPDGEVKLKGAFAPPEPGASGWPNPTGQICVTAVTEYLAHGVPLADTIHTCNDVRQFVHVRQVKGGGSYLPVAQLPKSTTLTAMRAILGVEGLASDRVRALYDEHRDRTLTQAEYLGKAVRWYYAQGSQGCILTPAGGLVARTEGCRPLMELPDTLPDDIDYDWYIREARSLLADIGIAP